MPEQEFYLASDETIPLIEVRACRILKRFRVRGRDDYALVHVTPPIPGYAIGQEGDITELILATRWQNTTLFPISEDFLGVYICTLINDEVKTQDEITANDIKYHAIGYVYRKQKDAMDSLPSPKEKSRRI